MTRSRTHTAGAIVVEGKVISGRTCNSARENCYIAAHDARTGKEVWRFYTAPRPGEPGDESGPERRPREPARGDLGLARRLRSRAPARLLGHRQPDAEHARRSARRRPDAIPPTAPADLYSNSTVALRPDTGELVWYYQHLPGDDWDMDINQEKTLIRTVVDPDPRFVKWINPDVPKGVARDVLITVGEGGGIWVNDRATGQFLWAMPFPYDTPNFILSDIDVRTGVTRINESLVWTSPAANQHRLLLEYAQLLADRVSSAAELALRSLHRSLSRHDARRARRRWRAAHRRQPAGIGSRRSSRGSRRST